MLPHVHHQYWIESGYVACFMKRDPVIGESAVGRILVADGPTDAAHLADANKICLPDVVVAKTRFGGPKESRVLFRITRTVSLHVAEIVFVQDHAVVFKSQDRKSTRLNSSHLV